MEAQQAGTAPTVSSRIPVDSWGDRTSLEGLAVGQEVTIKPQYVGGGSYRADFATGRAFIVKLAYPESVRIARTAGGPWFASVHVCRVEV